MLKQFPIDNDDLTLNFGKTYRKNNKFNLSKPWVKDGKEKLTLTKIVIHFTFFFHSYLCHHFPVKYDDIIMLESSPPLTLLIREFATLRSM
ncbi:CLUMA_CG021606, isoform A [Clunio marinus]|uniref:CLUMA_CG021606, isoform A n=1 Tax=Clunio marinus TaxID=568069 RepID=A0A1J1J807_9DIPT|nr:CLUMA_CG021606, isoform A [Clunio marinus]